MIDEIEEDEREEEEFDNRTREPSENEEVNEDEE